MTRKEDVPAQSVLPPTCSSHGALLWPLLLLRSEVRLLSWGLLLWCPSVLHVAGADPLLGRVPSGPRVDLQAQGDPGEGEQLREPDRCGGQPDLVQRVDVRVLGSSL